MRVVIITQNEPFYLSNNLKYLFKLLPKNVVVTGCVVNNVSPFGKQESFFKKSIKTLNIFGFKFFIHYSIKYIFNFFKNSKNIYTLLKKNKISIIKLHKNINHKESVAIIKSYKPDLLVSILGNQIFKKPIINLAHLGCLNLHTALLPKYRGLMPSFWVLKNNEKYTGVSVFFVDEGIDSGPIIVQKKFKIHQMTQKELIIYSKKLGMEAIAEAIKLIQTKKVRLIKNDSKKKTYYSFPKKEDVKIFLENGKKFF